MKILLLGSRGWIGSNIQKQRPDWTWTEIHSGICDLEDEKSTELLQGNFDVVIHTAGFFGGLPFNVKHKEDILTKNNKMNNNICRMVSRLKPKKFIAISSACLYPPHQNKILRESMIGSNGFHPSVKYSALAKLRLLELVKSINVNFEYLIISNAYGPGEHTDPEKSHFIGSLINKVKTNKYTLEMFGTGIGIRDYIYIEDVAEAICRYCELSDATNSVTNISNGQGITVKEITEKILEFSKKKLELKWGLEKDNGVKHKVLDNSKMVTDINFNPGTKIDKGLLKTWRFFNA
tara:strand:- start:910 stop:1785 length:876 start_codon:yes stop_codon:yes gene_type:complete